MASTVLVTGATGFLGREVHRAFKTAGWHVVGTGLSRANPPAIVKLDISDEHQVNAAFATYKPAVVVHCAANRYPDKCEANPSHAETVNVVATRLLCAACKRSATFMIYVSTDYIFSGRPGEAPYENSDKPDPSNVYGLTKLAGEQAVLEATQANMHAVVLRVPVLYGKAAEPKESAINVLLDAVWASQEREVEMDHWAKRYPTNTEDVSRVCLDVAIKYLSDNADRATLPRILQFSSEEVFTKYEICGIIAEILGITLGRMSPAYPNTIPNQAVQRPYDTHLSTKALVSLGIKVHTQDFRTWWRWQLNARRK